jgi:hypothetical protein
MDKWMTPEVDDNSGDKGPATGDLRPATKNKPWPLSWILIVILVYIALQTAYFLFFTE